MLWKIKDLRRPDNHRHRHHHLGYFAQKFIHKSGES